jgi:hypothetical protein
MVGQPLRAGVGIYFIVRDAYRHRKRLLALLVCAPMIAGCSGASDFFSSDLLSKDTEWFSRPSRLFIKNVSIETPPLTPDKAVTAEDLVSADGLCPGMSPPADANALTDGATAVPAVTGTVALGHTECDVVRGIGSPENVNLSSNSRGSRVAVVTYTRGARAGIYTFTSGRLTSVERVDGPAPQPKAAKPKKKPAAT